MRRLALLVAFGIAAAMLVRWRRRSRSAALVGAPGQRVLVVGTDPTPFARRVAPGGTVELVDADRAALDRWLTRAAAAGVEGIVATQADPASIPLPDASVDAAYVDRGGEAAMGEARRVVRTGGRVVARH